MQKKQLNVKLSEHEMTEIETLADSCEITSSALGGFFVRAALRAVKRRPAKLTVPLDFDIIEPEPRPEKSLSLNEGHPLTRRAAEDALRSGTKKKPSQIP